MSINVTGIREFIVTDDAIIVKCKTDRGADMVIELLHSKSPGYLAIARRMLTESLADTLVGEYEPVHGTVAEPGLSRSPAKGVG